MITDDIVGALLRGIRRCETGVINPRDFAVFAERLSMELSHHDTESGDEPKSLAVQFAMTEQDEEDGQPATILEAIRELANQF